MHNPERPKRIHLTKGGESRHEENLAGGVITPGMLIVLNSSNQVIAHATEGARTAPRFAVEDALQGRDIGTNYASGELVSHVIALPGDVIYAILEEGQNVAAGAKLASNGAGELQAVGGGTAIAEALEAIDATESDVTLADRRIRVLVY